MSPHFSPIPLVLCVLALQFGCSGSSPSTSEDTDCAGAEQGSAYVDACGQCVGGATGAVPCASDCAGVPGGVAVSDGCGVCTGGTTGVAPCEQDCNGTWGGTATLDACDACVGGTTGQAPCELYVETCPSPGVEGYVVPVGDGRWRVEFADDGVTNSSGACCMDTEAAALSAYPNRNLEVSTPGCMHSWADNHAPDAAHDGCLCERSSACASEEATLVFHIAAELGAEDDDRERLRYGVSCDGEQLLAGIYVGCERNSEDTYDCPGVEVPLCPPAGAVCWAYVEHFAPGRSIDLVTWEFGGTVHTGAGRASVRVE